ncbi:AraC family transcriptional regulator [Cohnella zeiphila]|uniref:AraC family transcriptional regulator n=1 Tax=Cohnella zeiphila TaxID=2761120 RepID=A0A7X0SJT7_9BACL|nr:AraC family transcriptional regulator [Cohnella zeiphila]MBB6730005.1 AraC family transcriptional regulator [Cohnella zeiphila]
MEKSPVLREEMDMPDPLFPIKIHHCRYEKTGATTFAHHWHEHLEFLYVVEGEARFSCNSETHDVVPGDIVIVNSADLHHGISLSDRLFYYAVIVDPALLHSHTVDTVEAKFITPIAQGRIRFANKISDDPIVRESLTSLIGEFNGQAFGYELAVKSWLYRLLTALLRRHTAVSLSPEQYSSRLRRLERLDPVFRHIEERYADKITVDELAGIARMSRFHFGRVFKELTNRSVTDYLNFVRINKSEYDLRHSEKTITEIALENGFGDVYYYSRLFKSYKNVTPSSLRKSPDPS